MNEPIIIGGCPSSGTTLLRAILNTHSNIACGPELGIFDRFFIYQKPFIEFRMLIQMTGELLDRTFNVRGNDQKKIDLLAEILDSSAPFPSATQFRAMGNCNLNYYVENWNALVDLIAPCESYEEFFDDLFGCFLIRNKKTRWAEKTPENIYFFKDCLRQFPNYRFIQVIRNPLDTIASMINRKRHPIDEELSLLRYIASIRQMQECLSNDRFFLVCYEDLVNDPKSTVKKVMNFLKEPFEKSQLEYYKSEMAQTADYAKTPIFNSSIGRGEKELSEEKIKKIIRLLNREIPTIFKYYDSKPKPLFRLLPSFGKFPRRGQQ